MTNPSSEKELEQVEFKKATGRRHGRWNLGGEGKGQIKRDIKELRGKGKADRRREEFTQRENEGEKTDPSYL